MEDLITWHLLRYIAVTLDCQEALECCLSSLTEESLPDTVHLLCDQLRRGVGLTTIAAAAKSLSYLSENYFELLGQSGVLCRTGLQAFHSIVGLVVSPRAGVSDIIRKAVGDAAGAFAKVINYFISRVFL